MGKLSFRVPTLSLDEVAVQGCPSTSEFLSTSSLESLCRHFILKMSLKASHLPTMNVVFMGTACEKVYGAHPIQAEFDEHRDDGHVEDAVFDGPCIDNIVHCGRS